MNQTMPELESLYLFRDVMQYGSFYAAAAATGGTAASLAKGIAKLEAKIGVPLFSPGSGGTTPTAGGLHLYDKLDSLFWNLETLIQQTRSIPEENSLKLVLGISDMIASAGYRDLLQAFAKNYPDVSLILKSLSWTDVRRSLAEGNIDAVLSYSVLYPRDPNLARKELTWSKPCIYYSEELIPVQPENLTIESFRNCPFVYLNSDVAVEDILKDLPFRPASICFVENLKTLQLYVSAGLACAMQGPSLQMAEIEGIRSFRVESVNYTMGADLVWDKSNRNPALPLLVHCAEKLFPALSHDPLQITVSR